MRRLGDYVQRRRRSLVTHLVTLGVLAGRDNALHDVVAVEIIFLEFRRACRFSFSMHPRVFGSDSHSLSDLVFADIEHHEILPESKRSS